MSLVALQLVQLLQLVPLNFFPFEKTICNLEDLNFFYLRRKFKHGSQEKTELAQLGQPAQLAQPLQLAQPALRKKTELAQLGQPAKPA